MPFAFRINSTASQDRLERLIQRRLQPDANKEEVDKHTSTIKAKAEPIPGVTYEAIPYVPEGAESAFKLHYQL